MRELRLWAANFYYMFTKDELSLNLYNSIRDSSLVFFLLLCSNLIIPPSMALFLAMNCMESKPALLHIFIVHLVLTRFRTHLVFLTVYKIWLSFSSEFWTVRQRLMSGKIVVYLRFLKTLSAIIYINFYGAKRCIFFCRKSTKAGQSNIIKTE